MQKILDLIKKWEDLEKFWFDKSNEDADRAYKIDARRESNRYKELIKELKNALDIKE